MRWLAGCYFLVAIGLQAFGQTPEVKPAGQGVEEPKAAVSLGGLSASLEELTDRVGRSVVQIFANGFAPADSDDDSGDTSLLTKQRSTGSGVILSSDGYILTNAHVVQTAKRVQVRLPSHRERVGPNRSITPAVGPTIDAKIIGTDHETDLAVIKIERHDLPYLELGNSDELRQGQLVLAFGNPLGLEGSVSMGIISSTSRQIETDSPMVYIQTDAPINPGNSGGPLVDGLGRVIGINTFILSQSGGSEGIGFAVPSNMARSVYRQIRRDGHVNRGQIGVKVQTVTPALATGLKLPQDWGVLVSDVEPDGPADNAGVKIGDIILTL
ncbi:MAG: S1C family serine protease, partial [Bryobacteraceae bacterium]